MFSSPALTEVKAATPSGDGAGGGDPVGSLNFPLGGVDSPCSLLPQQATVLSALNPQVCRHPALTERNCPPGGVD